MRRRLVGMLVALLGAWAVRGVAAHAAPPASLPTPPAGWALEVVAAAPRVRHPSVVCCAPDGRVFVAEDPMDIRLPKADAKQGRIVCLHPDGRTTTFAEGLHAVFGMQYLDGKLYVLHNPKYTVFIDDAAAGVGKDRRDLIESTNPNPWALNWNDHVPANFRLAMDGYFYVAVGDKGVYGAVGADGKRVDLRGGGILRLRPDGSGLEVFATGVRNILDVAINDEDELFTYDNTDEHDWMGRLTHMVEGGFYGYPYDFVPRRPYTLWMMADYGAGAATGADCYTGAALPPEYHGNLFLADFGKRNVLRVRVERDGATYKAVTREDLFTNVPADFRPVGICFAPDGASLYLCDWQHVDTKEDVEVGRLLKMTYTGQTSGQRNPAWYVPAATGRPFEATTDELVAALSNPSRDVRMTAQRRLAERPDSGIALRRLIDERAADPRARAHALWAMDALDGKSGWRTATHLTGDDPSPLVRRQALRQLGSRREATAIPRIWNRLKDDDASVRFHAATALGRVGIPTAVPGLMDALDEPDDWARHATFTALNRIGRDHPEAWKPIADGLRSESDRVREGVAFALRDTYDAALVAAVQAVAGDPRASEKTKVAAFHILGPLHRQAPAWKGEWWAYHPALAPPPARTVRWDGTDRVIGALTGVLKREAAEPAAVQIAALEALRDAADADAARPVLAYFESQPDPVRKRAALAALATCGNEATAGRIVAYLRDSAGEEGLAVEAIVALGTLKAPAALPLIVEHARSGNPRTRAAAFDALTKIAGDAAKEAVRDLLGDPAIDVRIAAIKAAGELGDRSFTPALLDAYRSARTRGAALAALAQMPHARAADVYLDGLTSLEFSLREKCKTALRDVRDDALPAVEQRLSTSPTDDLVLELQQIYSDHPKAKAGPLFRIVVTRKHPNEYLEFAAGQSGDAASGRNIFAESSSGGVGCATCHAVEGRGGTVGPDLSGVGAKYSRRDLAESILYPSKAVREGYQQVIVRTKNGQTYAGPVKAETADGITLHESDGTLRTVRKADVATRKDSGLSPMPEGVHTGLTEQQFADLISYLESLKTENPLKTEPPDKGKEPK